MSVQPPVSTSTIESDVETVCSSALFRKAPTQRELLRYLWQHRHQQISEYSIGVDALGRKSDFDPKIDSTVRVQISRLRQRLKEFYETEGAHLTQRIQIPMGEYRPGVVAVPAAPVATQPPSPAKLPWWLYAGAALLLVLLADDLRLRWANPRPPALPAFWSTVARPGSAIPIIVPAPVFFRWESSTIVARDFGANSGPELKDSAVLSSLARQLGPPEISQLYTVASDTRAASQLANYLQERGLKAEVLDTPAATVETLESRSGIVFVGPGTTTQLGSLLDGMNFHLVPQKGGVMNRAPRPGEPAHFASIRHSPSRSTNFGILARLPGRAAGLSALVFLSSFNPALLSVCLRPAELDRLDGMIRGIGSPAYFEAVVEFERNGDLVLQTRLVTIRPITR